MEWARLPAMRYATVSELVTLHNKAKVLVRLLRSVASDELASSCATRFPRSSLGHRLYGGGGAAATKQATLE
jgi:hypothetical protein